MWKILYFYLNKLQNITEVLIRDTNNCIQNFKYNNNIFKYSGYKLVRKKQRFEHNNSNIIKC